MKSILISYINVWKIGLSIFFLNFCVLSTLAQEGRIDYWNFKAKSLKSLKEISVRVYLPPNHDPKRAESYPYLIMNHGCCGASASDLVSPYKEALDSLIAQGEIEPIVVVFPSIHLKNSKLGKPDFLNQHSGINSAYYGNFGDVFIKNLIPKLEKELKYNLSSQKSRRAIGGFSSGADGAMRLAVDRNDYFVAMIGHSGLPTLNDFATPFFLDIIEKEMTGAVVAQKKGSFNFNYKTHSEILRNGFMTTVFLGLSALYSDEGKPIEDFVLNENGEVRSEIMEEDWIKEHNVLNMINDNPDFFEKPVEIYFEWDKSDPYAAPFNERFLKDLVTEGWKKNASGSDIKDFYFNHYQSKGHGLDFERAVNALMWLNGKWGEE